VPPEAIGAYEAREGGEVAEDESKAKVAATTAWIKKDMELEVAPKAVRKEKKNYIYKYIYIYV